MLWLLTLKPTLMMGRCLWHLRFTLYPCGGTALAAFEANTYSCGWTALASFEGNTYPCGGTALAAIEVVTPTPKVAMPIGNHQDSFVRDACGPDMSDPFWERASHSVRHMFSLYFDINLL